MTIEISRPLSSTWTQQTERDPFEDAAHVANGIHSNHPLAREARSGMEYFQKASEVRVLELGAVTLDASVTEL